MKIVWASNYHQQPTGYATVARHVIQYLQHNSRHQIVEFAVSGLARTLPSTWKGVTVYGNSGQGGQFGVGDWRIVQNLEKPDIWMVNFDAWAAGPLVAQSGVKYVIYPPIDHDPLPPLWESSLKKAEEIIPYCRFGQRVIREGLGEAFNILEPIPHGVDTEAFRPMQVNRSEVFGRDIPDEAFVIGIYKNNQGTRAKYETMFEGIRIFLDRVGDAPVWVYIHAAKTGQHAFNLGDLVNQFGLSGHVMLVAPQLYRYGLSDEELAKTYNACDVILNSVAGEGWGLPITEAFACGKPVIGLAFSSMPELLSGVEGEIEKRVWDKGECIETERGWLVPTAGEEFTLGKRSKRRVFRAEDVAAALSAAYETPSKRLDKGMRANKWVRRLDWKHVGNAWIKYFDGLETRLKKGRVTWPAIKSEGVGKKKTACVVFSFNRPDYLVQTLDSLSKNTRADDCDWYFYQDGWKNDPRYPYTTEEGEAEIHRLVNQCREILQEAPFKHRTIVDHDDNRCIGRQLQDAKDRLFRKYDKVIFFDDDHVVSRDYIDVLLKLHKQYPKAVVGAQATEIRNIPADAKVDEIGVTTKQISDRVARPGRWRWLAYLMPRSVYMKTKKDMDEYMEFIGSSYRNLPHHAVCVKWGVQISGFDGVLDAICDKLAIKRIATVLPRGKYIGRSGLFGRPQLYKDMGFDYNLRYEFDEPDTYRERKEK